MDNLSLLGKKRGNKFKSSYDSKVKENLDELSLERSDKIKSLSIKGKKSNSTITIEKEIKNNFSDFTPNNNLFYINLKDSSQTNSPENVEKLNDIENILYKSFQSSNKNQKENKNFEKNLFKDIEYKHLDDLKEFLIPYAKTLKEIKLKEVIDSYSFKDAEFQTTGVIDCRIQNLAITIDKVIHVMKINKDDKPPLVKLNTKEIIINLWTHPYSLRWSLINNIKILIDNSFSKGLIYNLEELSLILDILNKNYTDMNDFEDLFFKNKNEHIYNLIKINVKFIKENIKDKSKESFYYENKEALNQDFFDVIDKDNSFNNKYSFSFKNFNIKSNKQVDKITQKDLLNEKNAYWVNTKYLTEKEKKIKGKTDVKITVPEEIKEPIPKSEKIFNIGKNNKGIANVEYSIKQNHSILKAKSEDPKAYLCNDSIGANKPKERSNNIKKIDEKFLNDKKFSDELEKMNPQERNILLQNIKDVLKFISLVIKLCHYREKTINKDENSKLIYYEGLADMLYLHSCTQIYFKHNDAYGKQVESNESISIRDRDVKTYEDDVNNKHLDEKIHTGCKIYEKMYIWGQLVGWFKQTV